VSREVTELAAARQIIEQLARQNQALEQKVVLLEAKIDLLIRRIFGAKSEKLDAAQLELLLGGLESGKAQASEGLATPEAAPIVQLVKAQSKRTNRREARERWPNDLPLCQQIIDPQEVQADPQAWRYIGQEVSEQLDYQPAKFFRRQIIRRKYVSVEEVDQAPLIAPLPQSLQERCVAPRDYWHRSS
jgi:hypothetical protein